MVPWFIMTNQYRGLVPLFSGSLLFQECQVGMFCFYDKKTTADRHKTETGEFLLPLILQDA